MGSLVANNIVTGSPILSTGVVDNTDVVDWSAYFFEPIAYFNPAIAQDHSLSSVSILSGLPTVSDPVFVQGYVLTASNITSSEPSVPVIVMIEEEIFRPIPLATGIPVVNATSIAQDHQFVANEIVSTPTVGTVELSEENALTPTSIASEAPTLGTPITVVNWVLFADGFVAGQPAVGNTSISQGHVLSCSDLEARPPLVAVTNFLVGHNFIANPIVSVPTVGSAFINGSKRRILSITSDSTTRVELFELANSTEFNNSANSATYEEAFNRVS